MVQIQVAQWMWMSAQEILQDAPEIPMFNVSTCLDLSGIQLNQPQCMEANTAKG